MKKQILLLTFLSLAFVFAGMNSYGQYQTVPTASPQCITPVPLADCETDPPELHPIQGEDYTYEVTQTPANATIRWFVVNNADIDSLISMADGILAVDNGNIDATNATGGYDVANSEYVLNVTNGATAYNSTTTTATSITMSWKYFNGLAPEEVLLVAHIYDEVACTDNIAVWRIIPTPAFTLDVAALGAAGDSIAPARSTTDVADTCVSPIQSAFYNSAWGDTDASLTPGDSLRVDYGENWLFFVVNAANYIDSWMPTFQFTYTGGDAIPAFEASWAYSTDATSTDAANWHEISGTLSAIGTAATFTSAAPVIGTADASTEGTIGLGAGNVVGAAGECIVVRVKLDWGTEIEHDELLSTLRFAVDGVSYDGDDDATTGGGSFFDDRGYADLGNSGTAAADDCTDDEFDNDWIDYNITPRPAIEEGTLQEDKSGQGTN